jgi:hypothetical protein
MASFSFSNGQGQFSDIASGTYTVNKGLSNLTGYDNTTGIPSTIEITGSTDPITFTVGGTGTLTVHVENSFGDPVKGVELVRVYKDFNRTTVNTTYGPPSAPTDDNGNTTFANVPWSAIGAPNIYFTVNDPTKYEITSGVPFLTLSMTQQVQTLDAPEPISLITPFTVSDVNYTNLAIESGAIGLD